MNTVHDILQAIAKLSRDDFLELHALIQKQFDEESEREFETDVKSGALHEVAQAALKEHRAGASSLL
jgi:hypothetical protein